MDEFTASQSGADTDTENENLERRDTRTIEVSNQKAIR